MSRSARARILDGLCGASFQLAGLYNRLELLRDRLLHKILAHLGMQDNSIGSGWAV